MKLIFVILLICSSCFAQSRPFQPFVYRGNVDVRPRQIMVALHQDLWLMYDYPYCTLYMAWKGGSQGFTLIKPGYFVSQWSAGTQTPTEFKVSGQVYFKQENIDQFYPSWSTPAEIENYYGFWSDYPTGYRAWRVNKGGQNIEVKVKYKGYFTRVGGKDVFKLNFSLELPDATEIGITEVPEYVPGSGVGLSRTINITGIPTGHEVRLHLKGGSAVWKVSGGASLQGDEMIQGSDGECTILGAW